MIKITEITSKRETQIPVYIVEPSDLKEKMPLMVMNHGFMAEKTEDLRFVEVAIELAKKGIISVMGDFPGCGDSKEPFIEYHPANCLDDITSLVDYMLNNYPIDTARMGMLGYSMGGYFTTIYQEVDPRFKNIALWAPAIGCEESMLEMFGGGLSEEERNETLKTQGYVRYLNPFDGKILTISAGFYRSLEERKTLRILSEFDGNILFVHGNQDATVSIEESRKAFETATKVESKEFLIIKGADHGFGCWENEPAYSEKLVKETTDFLLKNLLA